MDIKEIMTRPVCMNKHEKHKLSITSILLHKTSPIVIEIYIYYVFLNLLLYISFLLPDVPCKTLRTLHGILPYSYVSGLVVPAGRTGW